MDGPMAGRLRNHGSVLLPEMWAGALSAFLQPALCVRIYNRSGGSINAPPSFLNVLHGKKFNKARLLAALEICMQMKSRERIELNIFIFGNIATLVVSSLSTIGAIIYFTFYIRFDLGSLTRSQIDNKATDSENGEERERERERGSVGEK